VGEVGVEGDLLGSTEMPSNGYASSAPASLPSGDLVVCLHELTSVVDALWQDALTERGGDRVVEIGEVSHGLHRVLIALDSFLAIKQLPAPIDDRLSGARGAT